MKASNNIEPLLKKPYWLIDVLPKQVPAGSAGQYLKAEEYFRARECAQAKGLFVWGPKQNEP